LHQLILAPQRIQNPTIDGNRLATGSHNELEVVDRTVHADGELAATVQDILDLELVRRARVFVSQLAKCGKVCASCLNGFFSNVTQQKFRANVHDPARARSCTDSFQCIAEQTLTAWPRLDHFRELSDTLSPIAVGGHIHALLCSGSR
jgi:hypothetical protein